MWRQIRTPQWLHALNWPVQFTWPHNLWRSWSSLSKPEYPIPLSDVRILHVWTTRIWWIEVCFRKSVASNYDPHKNESEPITYVVCCDQTVLTRISDSFHHTHVYVWQWMELCTHNITIDCSWWSRKRWTGNARSSFVSFLTSDRISLEEGYLSAKFSSDG